MAEDPPLPRTERPDAPLYLASYLRRRARAAADADPAADAADPATPLYLRRFRERRADPEAPGAPPPVWNGEPLEVTRAWAEITRTKEIVPETQAGAFKVAAQVHIVRHGETQGYSTESGLTPLGGWQAHRRGFDLSKGIRDGEQVQIVCADTNRARQTAEHLGVVGGAELQVRHPHLDVLEPQDSIGHGRVPSRCASAGSAG